MDTEDIVDELTALEIAEDHARLYVALLKAGASKARTLTKLTDYSRTKVYRLLDDLVEQGMASATVTQPTVYTAVAPDELFDRLLRGWQRGAERTEEVRHQLLEPLHRLSDGDADLTEPTWTVLDDRGAILDRTMDLLERAEESFVEMSTHGMCTTFSPPVRQAWNRLAERVKEDGIAFRGIFATDPDSRETLRDLAPDEGFDVRHMHPPAQVHYLVVDCSEALLYLDQAPAVGPSAEEDAAIVSDARGLVETLRLSFELAWKRAEPIEEDPLGRRVEGRL